jgi:hypothetical protein
MSITGRVDLHSLHLEHHPLWSSRSWRRFKNGFNENIFYSAGSTIEIKGQTNQLPINNNVSLYFEGSANTTVINSPKKFTSGGYF